MLPNTWLVVVSVFFGFAAHALSTDGGGSVLARLGVTDWAIPKSAVAPLILAFGLVAAVVGGVQQGLSWSDAAAQGLALSMTALFGAVGSQHLTGRDVASIVLFVGAAYLLVTIEACALFTPANVEKAAVIAADSAKCLEENQDLPDDAALVKCGIQEAERLLATNQLHTIRTETKKRVAAAMKFGCAHE